MKSKEITIQVAFVNEETIALFPAKLEKFIKEKDYHLNQVFYCDETKLFREMSNRIYVRNIAEEAPGYKIWTGRLTLVLCGNCGIG